MQYYAHSVIGRPKDQWQPLAAHLAQVAALAGCRGARFGAEQAAFLAGLLHDLGKYTRGFQRRLEGGERVDHASAGARAVLDRAAPRDRRMAELIAYAIAGHHGGLPDRRGVSGTLDARLKKDPAELDPAWETELGTLPTGLLPTGFQAEKDRLPFQLSMLCRFLFSCLVDADFRDTEAFYAKADGRGVDRGIAIPLPELKAKLDNHLAGMRKADSPTNRLRAQVLDHARAKAGAPTGLFSLTVPTGGGKTLTSLAFALDHAVRHGLDRVIYAIPFTSVIDQTAKIFRDILGEDAVLEHHSAIQLESADAEEGFRRKDERNKLRLAMEDWSAPVVVTTNVQLFESLFSNRPSRCRKLHNLAKAVIVLDEAQTIPLHVLRPCMAAVDELARNYRSSIVLCTATQPALGAPDFPEKKGGLKDIRELAPEPAELQRRLKRVTIRRVGEMDDEALVAALAERQQGLVIVNSRAHALALYRAAQEAGLDGLLHLTTRMVAAHRRAVLEAVRERLKDGLPCRVIATSLVEAGVDLDFPLVWRAEAGLDSILQAAGRCNREGRRLPEESIVTVFRSPDRPPPREIRGFAGDLERIAASHPDLNSLDAIRAYFGEVYWRKGMEALDRGNVIEKLRADATGTDFAFRSIAEEFRLIEEGMAPVIVPRDKESRRAVDALPFAERTGGLARRLQSYTVQVPPKARDELIASGQVRFVAKERLGDQFAVLESPGLYKDDVGLLWEEAGVLGIEASLY